jgi:hypothetical protein
MYDTRVTQHVLLSLFLSLSVGLSMAMNAAFHRPSRPIERTRIRFSWIDAGACIDSRVDNLKMIESHFSVPATTNHHD